MCIVESVREEGVYKTEYLNAVSWKAEKSGQGWPASTREHTMQPVYFFQEYWKLDLNALLFACISLGDPVKELAVLLVRELGTAVCFR